MNYRIAPIFVFILASSFYTNNGYGAVAAYEQQKARTAAAYETANSRGCQGYSCGFRSETTYTYSSPNDSANYANATPTGSTWRTVGSSFPRSFSSFFRPRYLSEY